MDTIVISLDLPAETVRELGARAASKRCSRTELVREAIDRTIWQARIDAIPEDDPTPDEIEAIARAREEFAPGRILKSGRSTA